MRPLLSESRRKDARAGLPKGIRAARARIARVAAAIVAAVLSFAAPGCRREERPLMGDVACPPPAAPDTQPTLQIMGEMVKRPDSR